MCVVVRLSAFRVFFCSSFIGAVRAVFVIVFIRERVRVRLSGFVLKFLFFCGRFV